LSKEFKRRGVFLFLLGSLGFLGVLKAAAAHALGQLPPDYFFLSPEFPSPRSDWGLQKSH